MTNGLRERIGAEFFRRVPRAPGVYVMLGDDDRLLYVGKAIDLRARLQSYCRDQDHPRIAQLVQRVRTIRYEVFATEQSAIRRETELLRATRPVFNVAQTHASDYLFVVVQELPRERVRLRLVETPDRVEGRAYGCFSRLARTTDGYPALVRVLSGAQGSSAPGRILRPEGVVTPLPESWRTPLHKLLSGMSDALLREAQSRIEDTAQPYARPALRAELEVAREWYKLGPRTTRRLRLKHRLQPGPVSTERMNAMVEADLADQLGTPVVNTRRGVEERVLELRASGLQFKEIVRRLNADRVPRLRGDGWWRQADVALLLRQATTRLDRRPAR